MSLTPPSGGRLFVEPLEARIAPTNLTGITNNTAFQNDPNYLQYSTAPRDGHLGFVPASAFGINAPNVYALVLTGTANGQPGDKVVIFNQVGGFGSQNIFLQSNVGKLVAFFQDGRDGQAPDGQVQTNELVGLALGKKTDTFVGGNVNGDVVTGLTGTFQLPLDSVGKPGFKINGLTVQGNINGNILSGGDINNVTIQGSVQNVLAGTAAYGTSFNFTGTSGAVSGTIAGGAYKAGQIGASINALSVVALTPNGTIHAGDGGALADGGSINNLTFQQDTDAFNVLGGAGGVGDANTAGGTGGGINSVLVKGVANTIANRLINIQAGQGGNNPEFKGGTGGSVNNVYTSFDALSLAQPSADQLHQSISVHGGDGGSGLRGGRGGDVLASNLYASISGDGTPTPEIQVSGGNGGALVDGSVKGGPGGSVSQVRAENLDTLPDAVSSTIFIQGGNGTLGKPGGDVDAVTLLGHDLVVNGGNGADSSGKGGRGGSLVNVTLDNRPNLFTTYLTLNGGTGGNGGTGKGGDGGSITTVQMNDADLALININTGTHGDGGSSAGSFGGNGGSVSGVLFNNSAASGIVATTTMRTGNGGNGQTGGGAGGDMANFQFVGTSYNFTITGGNGGSVNANGGTGSGGAGGNMTNVQLANIPDVSAFPATSTTIDPVTGFPTTGPTTILPTDYANLIGLVGSVTAGSGGSGPLDGGAGGALASVNLLTGDTVAMHAGNGGAGGSGVSGAGGAVSTSGANSLAGSVTATAGNAGLGGAGAGAGGTVNGFAASASAFLGLPGNITIRAGDGQSGGAGGSILNTGTSLNTLTGVANIGSDTIVAGAGSAGANLGGAGGSINTFNGQVALGGFTIMAAGHGGGVGGGLKVGVGGSVTNVTLRGSGNASGLTNGDPSLGLSLAQQIYMDAGDAGTSDANKKGAAGGSVDTVTISNLDLDTVVHHIAAGDGSSGVKRGADGGSISNVRVGTAGDLTADIGFRSGVAFGYQGGQSGGLFAGVGGNGSKFHGANGNVTNISANAISSIVAGKDARVNLVNMIDGIDLNNLGDTAQTRANPDGSFINFDSAYLVGSVYNNGNGPTTAGASTFKQGDGLIAAVTLTDNRNFQPEAFLTFDANGNRVLADYQQPNPTIQLINPALVGLA